MYFLHVENDLDDSSHSFVFHQWLRQLQGIDLGARIKGDISDVDGTPSPVSVAFSPPVLVCLIVIACLARSSHQPPQVIGNHDLPERLLRGALTSEKLRSHIIQNRLELGGIPFQFWPAVF